MHHTWATLRAVIGLLLIFSAGMLAPATGAAHYATLTTGQLVAPGQFQAIPELQFYSDDGLHANLAARLDGGLSEDSNYRIVLGFGSIDFELGGYFKWVPIPDFDYQPAIGLMVGGSYLRDGNASEFSGRLHPFISKTFTAEGNVWTVYSSLPMGFGDRDGEFVTPVQLALGGEVVLDHLRQVGWMAEIGIPITEAFSYLSLAARIRFD